MKTRNVMMMNKHDFLCKYFAGDAKYYDSDTGKRVYTPDVDWENKIYRSYYNYHYIWKPCYQEKDVTGVSIISNLVRYFVGSILGACLVFIGLYILYNIIKTIYLFLIHQPTSFFWANTTLGVCWVGLIVLLLKIWDILENWKIEKCVLGKPEEDDEE